MQSLVNKPEYRSLHNTWLCMKGHNQTKKMSAVLNSQVHIIYNHLSSIIVPLALGRSIGDCFGTQWLSALLLPTACLLMCSARDLSSFFTNTHTRARAREHTHKHTESTLMHAHKVMKPKAEHRREQNREAGWVKMVSNTAKSKHHGRIVYIRITQFVYFMAGSRAFLLFAAPAPLPPVSLHNVVLSDSTWTH